MRGAVYDFLAVSKIISIGSNTMIKIISSICPPLLFYIECGNGITPAYAGSRVYNGDHFIPGQDHPRVCGEQSPLLA